MTKNIIDYNTNVKESLIFIDTETTGVDLQIDGVIEIGCIKIKNLNNLMEEQEFHKFIKPKCEINIHAFNVHGISMESLKNKPFFEEIASEFVDFIQNGVLIAHNASFDLKFLNKELSLCNYPPIQNKVIDSLTVAKQIYPGLANGLDALMKRFKMPARGFHSALEDARILKNVYSEMCNASLIKSSALAFGDDGVVEKKQYSFSKKRIDV